jgi:hypothetical protein
MEAICSPKRRLTFTALHRVSSPKIQLSITTAVRTPHCASDTCLRNVSDPVTLYQTARLPYPPDRRTSPSRSLMRNDFAGCMAPPHWHPDTTHRARWLDSTASSQRMRAARATWPHRNATVSIKKIGKTGASLLTISNHSVLTCSTWVRVQRRDCILSISPRVITVSSGCVPLDSGER